MLDLKVLNAGINLNRWKSREHIKNWHNCVNFLTFGSIRPDLADLEFKGFIPVAMVQRAG